MKYCGIMQGLVKQQKYCNLLKLEWVCHSINLLMQTGIVKKTQLIKIDFTPLFNRKLFED